MTTPLWKQEHGPEFEPAPEVLRLLDLDGVRDASWHNDTCCHFEYHRPDGTFAEIWFDHPDPKQRENGPTAPRYLVSQRTDEDEPMGEGFATEHGAAAAARFKDMMREQLAIIGSAVGRIAAKHSDWIPPTFEYPGTIEARFPEIERSLTWGVSNETWGADVNIDDGNSVEPAQDHDEIITCLASDLDSRTADAVKIARTIVAESEKFLQNFRALANVDIDELADRMTELAIEHRLDTDPKELSDIVIWKPVLEAFPSVKTGDMDIGLSLDLTRAIEALCAEPEGNMSAEVGPNVNAAAVQARRVIERALRDWLRANLCVPAA